ncbi:Hypothetical predicted protein [Mytilus galloprovincialis]|uniref:Reverse transcriptase domain-containing protein n=1 Tax=Mytilus galloprovincialis TaxID=29158 RepID=A0A8B6BQA6_MYTGA|nr:Hypothetical predicted protein [Mytilus galloprovincialis]
MYKLTKSYLYNRRARVLVDGQCGEKVIFKQGVPQGGVLPPTLCILFMNDLVPELPKRGTLSTVRRRSCSLVFRIVCNYS